MNQLRAQVYALLDNPRAALFLLSRVEEDVRAAKAVAKWAITGVATPFTDEPSPHSGQVKIVLGNEFAHPGSSGRGLYLAKLARLREGLDSSGPVVHPPRATLATPYAAG